MANKSNWTSTPNPSVPLAVVTQTVPEHTQGGISTSERNLTGYQHIQTCTHIFTASSIWAKKGTNVLSFN